MGRARLGLAGVLFLLSGAAALFYQVSWQRILGVFSGVHIYSITIIVTAFMAGLGFGSFFGGRYADRLGVRRSIIGFAICEAVIGAFGLISGWLFYDVANEQLGGLVRYPAVLPIVHLTLLFIPTFLMGASLPLLSRGLVLSQAVAARTISVLYGVNTLGAASGAFLATWLLFSEVGFSGTIQAAAILNLLAAAGAVGLAAVEPNESRASRTVSSRSPSERTVTAETGPGLGLFSWAGLYALGGFVALSLELLWFRVLDVMIKSSPYTFGHLLGTFLLFLALGSLVGSRLLERSRRPDRVFFVGQWAITLTAGIAIAAFARLPVDSGLLAKLYRFWTSDSGLVFLQISEAWEQRATPAGAAVVDLAVTIYLWLPLALLAVPTFLMGLTFAFLQRAVQTDVKELGWRVGVIQTANIVGSILGSFLTGTVFLQVLGTPATFRVLIAFGAVFGLFAASRFAGRVRWITGVAAIAAAALLIAAIPGRDAFWSRLHGSPQPDVVISEDASSIVTLQNLRDGRAVLRVNGTGHSVIPYGGPHTLLGVFPVLLHEAPQEALVIGLGAGNTAWAAAAAPTLERVDVYEIAEPEYTVIRRYEDRWFPFSPIKQLLSDPRVHLTFADGRLALRTEPRLYDTIEVDALEPYMAYSGNLYSLEFFESARDRLKPGGYFTTYTPSERSRTTMVAAFPYVVHLYAPQYLSFMVGSNDPIDVDLEAMRQKLESEAFQAYFRRSGLSEQVIADMRNFFSQVTMLEIGPTNRESFLDGEINEDLFPRDEFDKATPVEG